MTEPDERRVFIVHAAVEGRLRLKVAGLYRSEPVKALLEAALIQNTAVSQFTANTRSGSLLIMYDQSVDVSELVQQVEALAAGANNSPERSRNRPASQSGLPQLDLSALWQRIRQLLALPQKRPIGRRVEVKHNLVAKEWHAMPADEVISDLQVSPASGLDAAEVEERLARYGENRLQQNTRRSELSILLGQFATLPVAMLGVSAVISIATGGFIDAAVIAGVVVINAAIGFVTERQAEITIRSLDQLEQHSAAVLRNGSLTQVPVESVVAGDILVLAPGSYVPADVRLFKSHRLSIDESALTGESLPVTKRHDFLARQDTPLGDRLNMLYRGTQITGGSGSGVVVATGKSTELGRIQMLVGEAKPPETPMQRQLDEMGSQLAILSGLICVGVFGTGLLRGYTLLEMLKASVSLAVAAVPEGLPTVATTTLALGIKDMNKRKVAIRHLDAVEALGSMQTLCLDKTGTLTENRMAVVQVFCGRGAINVRARHFKMGKRLLDPLARQDLRQLLWVASLCSETELVKTEHEVKPEGSPTEVALVEMAMNAGLDLLELREQHPALHTRYRAEGRPYMSTLHRQMENGKYLLAVKGSPAELLGLCDFYQLGARKLRMTSHQRQKIEIANQHMAGDALRVLAFACAELESDTMPRKISGLTWLGLAGMADPIRESMPELMAEFHQAGIKTVMITGDQMATAQAIGRSLDLSNGRPLKVLEAADLANMDDELLAGLAVNTDVFARVSPTDKLKIVQALQASGQVVGMTGDGINDGPALKAADIGVAMGTSGTDTARSVADVVLEDDNLHTMAVAVRQGRTIYTNIRKTVHFLVSTNLTEIEVMLIGIGLGIGQPLNPMQLLWINLVSDIFPGLALSMEPAEPNVMSQPPRSTGESIIPRDKLKRMVFESSTISGAALAAYGIGLARYGIGAQASTLGFTTLTISELLHAISCRTQYRRLMQDSHMPTNAYLDAALLGTLGAQALAMFVPGLRRLLGTTSIGLADALVIGGGVLAPTLINELTKKVGQHGQTDT